MDHARPERAGALAGLLVATMRADEREHPAEHEAVARLVDGTAAGSALDFAHLVERLARISNAQTAAAFAVACARLLPPETREAAVRAVVEVILADGRVTAEERDVLLRVREAFSATP